MRAILLIVCICVALATGGLETTPTAEAETAPTVGLMGAMPLDQV